MHDHANLLGQVRAELPSDRVLSDLAALFKLFGDPTRIKILYALLDKELCVCALCELLDIEQSAVSHQLRRLKAANLVKCRREWKNIYYSLSDNHVRSILVQSLTHISER